MKIPFESIDSEWTLFLDRDGVINHQKENGYINFPDEFEFYDGVIEAISICTLHFGRIIVVTNQRGVGKGITTLENLQGIHKKMTATIEEAKGKIDAVYFCTDTSDESPCRKPNTRMAIQAKTAFPEIDFSKSIMIGNSLSDLQFGRNLGTYTVFLRTTNKTPNPQIIENADLLLDHLAEFSRLLKS